MVYGVAWAPVDPKAKASNTIWRLLFMRAYLDSRVLDSLQPALAAAAELICTQAKPARPVPSVTACQLRVECDPCTIWDTRTLHSLHRDAGDGDADLSRPVGTTRSTWQNAPTQ